MEIIKMEQKFNVDSELLSKIGVNCPKKIFEELKFLMSPLISELTTAYEVNFNNPLYNNYKVDMIRKITTMEFWSYKKIFSPIKKHKEMKTENIEIEEFFEQPMLDAILKYPESVIVLPIAFYEKFKAFLIQEERFEDMILLDKIKDKVVNKTVKEFLDESEEIDGIF